MSEQLQASSPWTLEEDLILDNGVAAFDEGNVPAHSTPTDDDGDDDDVATSD